MDQDAFSRQVLELVLWRLCKTNLEEAAQALLSDCVKSAMTFSPNHLAKTDWHRDLATKGTPTNMQKQIDLYSTMPRFLNYGSLGITTMFHGSHFRPDNFAAELAVDCLINGLNRILKELACIMREESDIARLWEQFGLTPAVAEYCASLSREWEDSVWSLVDSAERLSRDKLPG